MTSPVTASARLVGHCETVLDVLAHGDVGTADAYLQVVLQEEGREAYEVVCRMIQLRTGGPPK